MKRRRAIFYRSNLHTFHHTIYCLVAKYLARIYESNLGKSRETIMRAISLPNRLSCHVHASDSPSQQYRLSTVSRSSCLVDFTLAFHATWLPNRFPKIPKVSTGISCRDRCTSRGGYGCTGMSVVAVPSIVDGTIIV